MNLSVHFLEEDASKKCAGMELQLHAFLAATIDRDESSVSHLSRYIYIWGKIPHCSF
jgi:hypothetical protein